MARDAQALTIGDGSANNFTEVDQSVFARDPNSPLQPLGIVSMRGSFTLNGSGVGDTADCRLTLPLPGTDFYQLHSFLIAIEGTSQYTQGTYELYHATKPVGFGQTTLLQYPLLQTDPARDNTGGVGDSVTNIMLAAGTAQSSGDPLSIMPDEIQQPSRLMQTGSNNGGTDPVVWISGGGATNIDAGSCRLAITFLRYSIEQFLAAPLYTGLSHR